jgi:hypothetical protein
MARPHCVCVFRIGIRFGEEQHGIMCTGRRSWMPCPAWRPLQNGLGLLQCGRTLTPCGAVYVPSCLQTHLQQVHVVVQHHFAIASCAWLSG